jgi:hypothetical protein
MTFTREYASTIQDAYESILKAIREETKNTNAEDAVLKACKINPDVREYLGRLSTLEDCIESHMVWRFRYWITHGEEERIRVVQDGPELLLS